MSFDGVVLFVVERMFLEINKIIEIIFKRLDIIEGSYVFLNQYFMFNNQNSELNVFDLEDVVFFYVIFFLCLFFLCLFQFISNFSIYDYMGMYVFDLLK